MTAHAITTALNGTWHRTFGMVPCPLPGHGKGKGDKNPSLKVVDGQDGEVVLHCFAGCDWRDVRDELRHRGLLPDHDGGDGGDGDRVHRHQHQHRDRGHHHGPDRDQGADDQLRIEAARAMWRSAQPIAGTIGEQYFRNRAISIEIPCTIRYTAGLKHPDTGLDLPVVIMAVQNGEGSVVGVQRVFLRTDGTGKAQVSRPKMAKGIIAGGAVRLGPAGHEMGLCEGVETGLSVAQMHPALSVWCALSVGNLAGALLPPEVETLHLFVDGDKPDSPAAATAAKAALAHLNAGRRVQLHRPPIGKDWNDVLRECADTLEAANE